MTTFDLFVLGCGGGPYEDNLSSYFLKASDASWKDGVIALEAGSALGAVRKLLATHADVFATEAESVEKLTPAEVYSWIQCYLITHPHLDHLSGLVLSAGSTPRSSVPVHGTQYTLEAISDVFSGKVWPALASWTKRLDKPLLLSPLSPEDGYVALTDTISVRTMPISHGQSPISTGATDTPTRSPDSHSANSRSFEPYASSAFFLRHIPSAHEFLFFGDVEPDSLSSRPQTRDVWRTAAPKIPHTLSALFIECSWPAGRPDALLYGHLSPAHLADELSVLAREVIASRARSRANSRGSGSDGDEADDNEDDGNDRRRKRRRQSDEDAEVDVHGALAGLRVFVVHCKDDLHGKYDKPIHEVIAGQVRELVEDRALGAEIVAVEQGMLICAFLSSVTCALRARLLTDLRIAI
ncbi:cyclic-AMP phosphodiesterase [Cubamyces lactineus]|nr:cyclic-AMP phosphodiesterase [Cubamyces lactineus]